MYRAKYLSSLDSAICVGCNQLNKGEPLWGSGRYLGILFADGGSALRGPAQVRADTSGGLPVRHVHKMGGRRGAGAGGLCLRQA